MAKANRKFRAPPLFRFMHPRGSFRDFTYIRLVNYRQRKDAEAGVKARKQKDQKAINEHFHRMVKPSRNAKDAAAKLGIQIQNGFEIAKKWKNDNEYEKKNNERADAI